MAAPSQSVRLQALTSTIPSTLFSGRRKCPRGTTLRVDLIAVSRLASVIRQHPDFVLTSHFIEHFLESKQALKGGTVSCAMRLLLRVVPHMNGPSKGPSLTPLSELDRTSRRQSSNTCRQQTFSVWIAEDFADLSIIW